MALMMSRKSGSSRPTFSTNLYDGNRNENISIPCVSGKTYILVRSDYGDYASTSHPSEIVSGATLIEKKAYFEKTDNTYEWSQELMYVKATANTMVVKAGSGLAKVAYSLIEL